MVTKPHIYKFGGLWWVCRGGKTAYRMDLTNFDFPLETLSAGKYINDSPWDISLGVKKKTP